MIGLNNSLRKWEIIRRKLGFPRLNPPRMLSGREAKEFGMEDEIAAIRLDDRTIFVNEKNLEQRVGRKHLPRVIKHEVMHYLACPRGLRNYVRMVGHADLVVRNLRLAKIIQNLYADLCINTQAYREGDKGMVDLYRKLSRGNENSEAWQIYMATYENMIGCQGMIIPQPKEEIRVKAKKLADIVNGAIGQSNKWPDSIKKFARIVEEYLRNDDQKRKEAQKQKGQGQGQPQTAPQNAPDVTKGLISSHEAKDFVPYDPKKTSKKEISKKIEGELKGLSQELGPKEFKRVISGLGLETSYQANIWLYRELASNYTLFFPQVPNHRSGEFKHSPKKWGTEDPISRLDYNYSYRRSPVIIPNVTAWQWEYLNGENFSNGEDKPDLLIVIDSSGSMPDPRKDMSFPVLTAVIAADSALAYGSSVAVINFSTYYKSCDFTNQSREIDELIVKYQNGGTDIPGEEMVRITSNHVYPIHTMIISDAGIHNLNPELANLELVRRNSAAGGSIFLCCAPSVEAKQLEEIGYDVSFARDFNDLGHMTLDKAKELYEGLALV
jgi:hypothetical protein